MTEYYVGIDLGGTNIKAGVVDHQAKVISKLSIPTEGAKGRDRVVENICKSAELAMKKAGVAVEQVRAIGIGSPGVFDKAATEVVFAPNLPDWNHVPLVKILQERFDRPTALDNDANAAAWGEFWAGAGRDVNTMVMLTLGTGIGGGIILDGMLWRGDRKSTRLNSSHIPLSRMPSSA